MPRHRGFGTGGCNWPDNSGFDLPHIEGTRPEQGVVAVSERPSFVCAA